MLTELRISNFALIDELTIPFAGGLTVISGETGAGKSVILQALELILGARASAHYVRGGEDALEVEAHFDLSALPKATFDSLPDVARFEEIVLTRKVHRDGKGKVYINGRLGTVSLLEEIATAMVNICGQGQYVRLTDPAYHLEVIDGFGGHDEILSKYKEKYETWVLKRKKLEALESSIAEGEKRKEILEETIKELDALSLKDGLREELEGDIKRLGSAEEILKIHQEATSLFSGDDGILALLGRVGGLAQTLQKLDPSFSGRSALFVSGRAEVLAFAEELDLYASRVDVDEDTLENLRSRLAELARCERKYKTNTVGLIEKFNQANEELLALSEVGSIETLRAEVLTLEANSKAIAAELTAARHVAGRKLIKIVEKDLADLNMASTRLKVDITPLSSLGAFGGDRVEFLIAPHSGEEFRPLKQIASGGELSRIMLVLKKVLRDRSGVNVLVFDEVDTGVSGAVARSMGEKLKVLSESSQVVCITHLPQVASLADNHLLVQKLPGERATTTVKALNGKERVEEVARMLSGHKITETSRKSARELLGV